VENGRVAMEGCGRGMKSTKKKKMGEVSVRNDVY